MPKVSATKMLMSLLFFVSVARASDLPDGIRYDIQQTCHIYKSNAEFGAPDGFFPSDQGLQNPLDGTPIGDRLFRTYLAHAAINMDYKSQDLEQTYLVRNPNAQEVLLKCFKGDREMLTRFYFDLSRQEIEAKSMAFQFQIFSVIGLEGAGLSRLLLLRLPVGLRPTATWVTRIILASALVASIKDVIGNHWQLDEKKEVTTSGNKIERSAEHIQKENDELGSMQLKLIHDLLIQQDEIKAKIKQTKDPARLGLLNGYLSKTQTALFHLEKK
jgi:hypothetical protein